MREYVYDSGTFRPLALLTQEGSLRESWHYHCDPNDWVQSITGKKSCKNFDWKNVSPFEITRLSNKMFDAAEAVDLQKNARQDYYPAIKK
ncbi:hypothetical protein ACOJCY_000171 [Cronobacter dublinensis]